MLPAKLPDASQGEHHDQVTGDHHQHQDEDDAAVQVAVHRVHSLRRAGGGSGEPGRGRGRGTVAAIRIWDELKYYYLNIAIKKKKDDNNNKEASVNDNFKIMILERMIITNEKII